MAPDLLRKELFPMKVVYSTCCGVDVHKTFLVATIKLPKASGLPTKKNVSLLSTVISGVSNSGSLIIPVLMSVWNLPASTGFLFLIFWRRIISGLLFLTPNIPGLKRATRLIVRMPGGFAIYICAEWSNLPLFHLLTSVN